MALYIHGTAVLNDDVEYILDGHEVEYYDLTESCDKVISTNEFVDRATQLGIKNITGSGDLDDDDCNWFIKYEDGTEEFRDGVAEVRKWLMDWQRTNLKE